MSNIITGPHNPLSTLIIMLVMMHIVWVSCLLNLPPVSIGDWAILIFSSLFCLWFDLGFLYMRFFYKDEPAHEIATKTEDTE